MHRYGVREGSCKNRIVKQRHGASIQLRGKQIVTVPTFEKLVRFQNMTRK